MRAAGQRKAILTLLRQQVSWRPSTQLHIRLLHARQRVWLQARSSIIRHYVLDDCVFSDAVLCLGNWQTCTDAIDRVDVRMIENKLRWCLAVGCAVLHSCLMLLSASCIHG